jgi:uncharacterized protein YceK
MKNILILVAITVLAGCSSMGFGESAGSGSNSGLSSGGAGSSGVSRYVSDSIFRHENASDPYHGG